MKWFKHDTDGHRSEGLIQLKEKHGREWVARWYEILEMVAEKMDETDRCHLRLPVSVWCKRLDCTAKKLRSFLDDGVKNLSISYEEDAETLLITIPNLLNKRDNHTRQLVSHLQVTDKLARANTKSQEKEKEPEPDQSPQTPLALTPSPALALAGPGRVAAVETLGNGKAGGAVSIAQALAGVSVNRPDPEEWERWKHADLKRVLAEQRAAAQAEREAQFKAASSRAERDAVDFTEAFAELIPNCTDQTKANIHTAVKKLPAETVQTILTNTVEFVNSGQARSPEKIILHRLRNP